MVCFLTSCSHEQQIHIYAKDMLQYLDVTQSYLVKVGNIPDNRYDNNVTVTENDVISYLTPLLDDTNPLESLNDEFVVNNTSYSNVEEYLDYVNKYLYLIKQNELYLSHKTDFLNSVISSSVFSLNEEDILRHSAYIVKSYEQIAQSFNMSLEEYYSAQNYSKDQFYTQCYNEAEHDIKQYIIVGTLAERYSITVTDDELCDEYKKYGYDDAFIEENKERISYINYLFLETKTLQTILYGEMLTYHDTEVTTQ